MEDDVYENMFIPKGSLVCCCLGRYPLECADFFPKDYR